MKKTLITILCTVLACSCVMGVTLAFLMDRTTTITNTFTIGSVDIDLTETKGTLENDLRTFKMVPGSTIEKDPTVTVKNKSEACWLFVKIEEGANTYESGGVSEKFITYAIADGWTALAGVDGVYYREVAATTADMPFSVLKDNQVKVSDGITKEVADTLIAAGTTYPTLSFTAYAVQRDTVVATAADAWSVATTGALPANNGD